MTASPWRLNQRFTSSVPGVPDTGRHPRTVNQAMYACVLPEPVSGPVLRAWSPQVAPLVGLPPEPLPDLVPMLAGNHVPDGARPYAAGYGGHQFGHWAGQLGDGRAITLGEGLGVDGTYRDVQLKGAGRTPFSRGADGRAVLRSSIREFLCSEAMHHLGIPTTRALSLCTTGEGVRRDMFYDGRARSEPGAVVCRVARTFLRFGSFQLFASRRDRERLRILVDHTLREHFPHLDPEGGDTTRLAWLHEVAQRTLDLVVHWQRVGFVHGVLNTDNMSIVGLTLDYGPYGWLDDFDADYTPNTSDPQGRYRYAHQPGIGAWNLARLLEAIALDMDDPSAIQEVLDAYTKGFGVAFLDMMRAKLGLVDQDAEDPELIDELFDLMGQSPTDYTRLFRALADVPVAASESGWPALQGAFYERASQEGWQAWLERYAGRVRADGGAPDSRRSRMCAVNPAFILRNHLVFRAIELAEQGDFTELSALQDRLVTPYVAAPDDPLRFTDLRPEWALSQPGCSTLSCSS